MDGTFFANVREGAGIPPIQLPRSPKGTEFSTTVDMAKYANSFQKNLLQTQGTPVGCLQARKSCWNSIPSKVSGSMNPNLTKPINLEEMHDTMKALPAGLDGFLVEFFLQFWKCIGQDILEVCRNALEVGALRKKLNTGKFAYYQKVGTKQT